MLFNLIFAAATLAFPSDFDLSEFLHEQPLEVESTYNSVVPPSSSLVFGGFTVDNTAFQTYECQVNVWTQVSANAVIDGNQMAHYFADGVPTFEHADGSVVQIVSKTAIDSPSDPVESIKWLQVLETKTSGEGLLSNVTVVLRTLTVGGVAPTGECQDGETVHVPYEAMYTFYA